VTRLERIGLALALASMFLVLAEGRVPASWLLRAAVVAFGVGAALVVNPRRP